MRARAHSRSPRQTQSLARCLARFFVAGDVVGLVGTLGAGKTTLVQGLARALGLPPGAYATSPTFTVMNEYPTAPRILHFDFYRLNDIDELYEVGFNDAARSEALTLVEWMDALPDSWELASFRLDIEEDASDPLHARRFMLTALTESAALRLATKPPRGFLPGAE